MLRVSVAQQHLYRNALTTTRFYSVTKVLTGYLKKGMQLGTAPLMNNLNELIRLNSLTNSTIRCVTISDGPCRGLGASDDLVKEAPLVVLRDYFDTCRVACDVERNRSPACGDYRAAQLIGSPVVLIGR